jgi:hypothetical protein
LRGDLQALGEIDLHELHATLMHYKYFSREMDSNNPSVFSKISGNTYLHFANDINQANGNMQATTGLNGINGHMHSANGINSINGHTHSTNRINSFNDHMHSANGINGVNGVTSDHGLADHACHVNGAIQVETPVLIVGGGPTGLLLAHLCLD